MAIKFLSKELDWGSDIYIKKDETQTPYTLIGIHLAPGGAVIFQLSSGFETFDVFDFEISTEVNPILKYGYTDKEED